MEGLGALPLPGAPAKPGPARAEEYVAPSESNLLEVEQNFQHELRRGFAENLPQSIGYLRQRLQSFVKNESDTSNLRWMEERSAILPSLGATKYDFSRTAIQNTPQGEDAPLNQVLLPSRWNS